MLKRAALVSSSVMLLALPFTAHEEGLRTAAYLDSVGVPTICYGETEGVKLGDRKTKTECDVIFYAKLGVFAHAIDMTIQPALSDPTHAALTSWSYNVGMGAMRGSTLVKKANRGDIIGACKELIKKDESSGVCRGYGCGWAGGRMIKGIQNRRVREHKLCLKGIEDAKIVPSSSRSISSWNN